MTDKGLEFVGKGCPQLQSLNVAHCEEVTDKGLEFVGKRCPFVKIIGR